MMSALPAVGFAGLNQDYPPSSRTHAGPARRRGPAKAGRVPDAADEAVRIHLSEEAQASIGGVAGQGSAMSQELAPAILEGLAAFRQEAERLFDLLGLGPEAARNAAARAAEAICAEAGKPAFSAELDRFLAAQPSETSGRSSRWASLIVQEAMVTWDPSTKVCAAAVRYVALSVEAEGGGIIPRGSHQECDAGETGGMVIRLDAVIPLHHASGRKGAAGARD